MSEHERRLWIAAFVLIFVIAVINGARAAAEMGVLG